EPAFLVLHHAEFHIGVEELAEGLAGGSGHFALHGENLFLTSWQRMRLEADDPLQREAKRLDLLGLEVLLERFFRQREKLGAGVARGLRGPRGKILKTSNQ